MYNSTKKLYTDALFNVITERIYVKKYLLLRNDEYAQYEKHWGKIVTVLIISEQSHTHNLYFNIVFY